MRTSGQKEERVQRLRAQGVLQEGKMPASGARATGRKKGLELYSQGCDGCSSGDRRFFSLSERSPRLQLHHNQTTLPAGTVQAGLQLRGRFLVCVEQAHRRQMLQTRKPRQRRVMDSRAEGKNCTAGRMQGK